MLRRRGIVVMDFDCYTGDRSSIPTHDDSLGKWMNLRLGKPMPCEGNWVADEILTYIVSINAKMGFSSASSNSTIYIHTYKIPGPLGPGEWRKLYKSAHNLREAGASYLVLLWTSPELANTQHFKKCVKTKISLIFYWFLLFCYT